MGFAGSMAAAVADKYKKAPLPVKAVKELAHYKLDKSQYGIVPQMFGYEGKISRTENQLKNIKGLATGNKEGIMDQVNRGKWVNEERQEKQAGFMQDYKAGLAGVAATASVMAGVHGANKLYQKVKTERIWNRLKEEHPELTSSPKDRENFEVLQQFSPDIASNIATARTYMGRLKHTGMAPHEFVKDIANIQSTTSRDSFGGHMIDVAKGSRFDMGASDDAAARLQFQKEKMDMDKSRFEYQQKHDAARLNYEEARFEAQQKMQKDRDMQASIDRSLDRTHRRAEFDAKQEFEKKKLDFQRQQFEEKTKMERAKIRLSKRKDDFGMARDLSKVHEGTPLGGDYIVDMEVGYNQGI